MEWPSPRRMHHSANESGAFCTSVHSSGKVNDKTWLKNCGCLFVDEVCMQGHCAGGGHRWHQHRSQQMHGGCHLVGGSIHDRICFLDARALLGDVRLNIKWLATAVPTNTAATHSCIHA